MNFEQFEYVVKNPRQKLKEYLEQGKRVVGCFHPYTPEQLIYAADFIPFGMWGEQTEVCSARGYFPESICGIIKTDFEAAIRGSYDGMTAVVIPTLCDSLRCATQNWKYAVPSIEMIPIQYPQNRESEEASSYLYIQYKKILNRFEILNDKQVTEESLQHAIDVYNEHNQVMRDFQRIASQYAKEISPLNRYYVMKSAYYMDKAEHTILVKELLSQLEDVTPRRFRGVRVVTTGMCIDSEDLLQIFGDNKISIVADDVVQESGQYRVDVEKEEDAISALVKQYMNMYACSTVVGGMSREQYITNLVEAHKADGVIIVHTKFCDPEEYDIPIIKSALEDKQIPVLAIEVDKQVRNYGQAATSVQSFQEMIRL